MIYIFGFGPMGKEYSKVLDSLGYKCKIIISSEISKQNYKNQIFEDDFLGFDALCGKKISDATVFLALPVEANKLVLENIVFSNCKIFIEKPVFYSLDDFNALNPLLTKNKIFINFNRRFYDFYNILVDYIRNEEVRRIILNYHERINFLPEKFSKNEVSNWVIHNGIHLFDLISHLFGKLKIIDFKSINTEFHIIEAMAGSTPFFINCSFDTFSSYSIELQSVKSSAHLSPIEKLRLIYPDKTMEYVTSLDFKPGFESMIKCALKNDFRRFVEPQEQRELIESIIPLNNLCRKYVES